MNRIAAAVLVVVGATIFSLIFVKQIRTSTNELSELFRDDNAMYSPSVAGATIVSPNAQADSPTQIDRSVNAVDLNSIDAGSARIEEQLKLMGQ